MNEQDIAHLTKSVTGTWKHVKSCVARTGGIVLRWSSGYGAGCYNSSDPDSIPGRDIFFDVFECSCLLSGPWLQLESHYKEKGGRGERGKEKN